MNYNYHTHTALCGHATGTLEEYVQRARACGIRKMGFSDHFPWKAPDGTEATFRVPLARLDEYRAEIFRLREKYKGDVDIFWGFEMEYYPDHFEEMAKNAISYGAEYLILGQHFIEPEYTGAGHLFAPISEATKLKKYVDLVTAAIKTGAFTYIAHPDVFHYAGGDPSLYREEMRRLCRCAKEHDVPLELNFLGIRQKRHYPNEEFWAVAGEEQVAVTFGFDSHDVEAACDSASLPIAERMVEKFGLRYIGEPRLVLLQDRVKK